MIQAVPTSAPTVSPTEPVGQVVTIRYSHYDPALGGTNCAVFVGGQCISNMSSGLPWRPWMGKAAACPPSWPFWTKVVLDGQEWVCLDRGGKIQYVAGVPWVDFLTKTPRYPYGTLVDVGIAWP